MSEIGDVFSALKDKNKKKKIDNAAKSKELLISHGVNFEEKNFGNHLIINHGGKVVGFWPSTGRYIAHGGIKGRGVFNLLKLIGVEL